MSDWPFIIAAYCVGAGGTIALVCASFVRMRRAERRADALKAQR